MAQPPIQQRDGAAAAPTLIELPKTAAPRGPTAEGTLDPQLLQEVLDKYAEQKGEAPGQTAEALGVQVVEADPQQTSPNRDAFVVINVAGGNQANQGLAADEPAPAADAAAGTAATTPAQAQALRNTPGFMKTRDQLRRDQSAQQMSQTVVDFGRDALFSNPNIDINALIQLVLQESYKGNSADIRSYSAKVEFFNNVKKQLRANENSARSFASGNIGQDGTYGNASFPVPTDPSKVFNGETQPTQTPHVWNDPATGAAGGTGTGAGAGTPGQQGSAAAATGDASQSGATTSQGPAPAATGDAASPNNASTSASGDQAGTAAAGQPGAAPGTPAADSPQVTGKISDQNAMDAYIADLDNQLQTVSDDSQLAQLQLQTLANNQQQLVQTMSNLAKSVHDTKMAIIRNISG